MGYALQLDDGRLRFEVDSNWQGELREPREKVLDLTTGAKVADGAWHHVARWSTRPARPPGSRPTADRSG